MFYQKNFNFFFFFAIFFFFFFWNFNLIDLYFKLSHDYSFFSLLHFFWISFFYLYLFLFLFFLFFFYKNFSIIVIYYLLICSFFALELQTNFFCNLNINFLCSNMTLVNPLLFNNLNKYHPIFLYYAFCLYIYLTVRMLVNILFNNFYGHVHYSAESLINLFNFFFFLAFTALFLGAWWADQEGSWGGWWNWDPSENLGLLILLFIFFNAHYRTKNFFIFKINWLVVYIIYFLLFIFYYLFLQLNFDIVSHNFGLKFLFFFNNNSFFTFISFMAINLFFFYIFFFFIFKLWIRCVYDQTRLIIFNFFFLTYFFLFFILIAISLLPLFNYFLWKFFMVTTLDLILSFIVWKLYVLFLLIFAASKYKTFYYFLILSDFFYIFIFHFLRIRGSFLRSLHLILILILTMVSMSTNFSYLSYFTTTTLYVSIRQLDCFFFSTHTVTLNAYFLHEYAFTETFFYLIANSKINNIFYFTAIFSFYFFTSFLAFFKTYLFNTNFFWNITFMFETYSSFFSQLTYLLLCVICGTIFFFLKKKKIS